METSPDPDTAKLRERLQLALGKAYTLERELGGGGMSRVFVAQDTRLGRRVAIKVLHPELAAGLSAARFEREITLAARLQHPHVVPVHASGDVDGLPYYTMPFVEGESLRARLRRDGALPLADAVRLVREIADAMAYAHAEGVVHRDLKPENVLLSGGHAVVADFGVAKALASATHGGTARSDIASAATATGLGLAVGTPAYMAPEQAVADPATDHRADLYALGLIAYEVLTGAHPFAGRTPQAMLAAHLTETPIPLAARRREVLPALSALISRLLAKRPEDRPQSAQEVVRALDTLTPMMTQTTRVDEESTSELLPAPRRARRAAMAVGGVVALVGAVAFLWMRRPAVPVASPADESAGAATPATLVERRVAVAPFVNQTGDSALAPLGSLASDWLTQGLAEAAFAEVVDPLTVRAAAANQADARSLGAATGARYVISGAYHLEGDSLRMFARVTDAADGKLLRTIGPVTAPAANPRQAVAALRERVPGAVGGVLDAPFDGAALSSGLPPSLEAYRHWSTGSEHFYRNEFQRAITEFLAAARLDSTFVAPVVWAAVAQSALGEAAGADSLFQIANRSRARLAPTDRHLLDGWRAENRGDWSRALQAGREVMRLSPGGMHGLTFTSWNAMRSNHPREAVAALERGDPARRPMRDYAPYWEVMTQAHHQLGAYQAELAAAVRGRGFHPGHVPLHFAEARALAALGRSGDAIRRLDAVLDLPPDPLYSPGELLWLLGRELRAHGQETAAQSTFARALEWYDGRPAAERASAALRGRRAEALYAAGRWNEARQLFERLAAERPGEPNPGGDKGALGLPRLGEVDYHGYLGALAARRGERASALATERALTAWSGPYLLGRHTFGRARIAALLGERERAVALLREALQQGRTSLVIHAEVDFASLRNLPAFEELVRPKD